MTTDDSPASRGHAALAAGRHGGGIGVGMSAEPRLEIAQSAGRVRVQGAFFV